MPFLSTQEAASALGLTRQGLRYQAPGVGTAIAYVLSLNAFRPIVSDTKPLSRHCDRGVSDTKPLSRRWNRKSSRRFGGMRSYWKFYALRRSTVKRKILCRFR